MKNHCRGGRYTVVHTHTHTFHTLAQVGDHSLWPVPAEYVTVLLQYTELVYVVISEARGSYQRK